MKKNIAMADESNLSQKAGKSPYQFGLRLLLALGVACCFFAMWLSNNLRRSTVENEILARFPGETGGQICGFFDYHISEQEAEFRDWEEFNYNQENDGPSQPVGEPPGPALLRNWLGENLFAKIVRVEITTQEEEINLSSLRGLKTLRELRFFKCPNLKKVSGLSELKSLVRLDLDSSNLDSLNGLEGLGELSRIESLSVYPTLSKKRGLKLNGQLPVLHSLKHLFVFAQDDDLGFVESTPNLETLFVRANRLTTLNGVESLSKLRSLSLRFCSKLSDIDSLAHCSALENVWIDRVDHKFDSIHPLTSLPRLRDLTLAGFEVSSRGNMGGLKNLRHLKSLSINANLSSLQFLNSMDLEELHLSFDYCDDLPKSELEFLRSQKNLRRLSLHGSTKVVSLDFLNPKIRNSLMELSLFHLPKIRELHLSKGVFNKLEKLNVVSCWGLAKISFDRNLVLKEMRLYQCPDLVFSPKVFGRLGELKLLLCDLSVDTKKLMSLQLKSPQLLIRQIPN